MIVNSFCIWPQCFWCISPIICPKNNCFAVYQSIACNQTLTKLATSVTCRRLHAEPEHSNYSATHNQPGTSHCQHTLSCSVHELSTNSLQTQYNHSTNSMQTILRVFGRHWHWPSLLAGGPERVWLRSKGMIRGVVRILSIGVGQNGLRNRRRWGLDGPERTWARSLVRRQMRRQDRLADCMQVRGQMRG